MVIFAFLAPLLHAAGWTWDEMLMLVVGLTLIIIVGYFGYRSERESAGQGRLLRSTAGNIPPQRQALSVRGVSQRYGRRWALAKTSLEGAGRSVREHFRTEWGRKIDLALYPGYADDADGWRCRYR